MTHPPQQPDRAHRPWPARHPFATLLATAAVVVTSVMMIMHLRISTSLAPLFSTEDPSAAAMATVLDEFVETDRLYIVVRWPDDTRASRAERQEALRGYRDRLRRAVTEDPEAEQFVRSVGRGPTAEVDRFVREVVIPNGIYYLDESELDRLLDRLSRHGIAEQVRLNEAVMSAPSAGAAASIEVVRGDPLRLHELLMNAVQDMAPRTTAAPQNGHDVPLIDADRTTMLIDVVGVQPASDMTFTKRFMPAMRRLVERAGPEPMRVEYAGAYAIAELSEREIRSDMIRSVVGSVILLQLIFLAAYRSVWSFALAFAPVVVGVLAGFATYSVITDALTPITAVLGGMLAGLGVDYCVHYLSHYEHHRHGSTPHEAMRLRGGLGAGLAAACATSVIAFGAIAASSVPALRSFAMLGILGLVGAFAATILVQPALLTLCERRSRSQATSVRPRMRLDGLVRRVTQTRSTALTLTGVLLIGAVCVLVIAGREAVLYESDMSVMHPQPNPPLHTQRRIAEQFGAGIDATPILLRADTTEGLLRLSHKINDRLTVDRADATRRGLIFGLHTLLPDLETTADRRSKIQQVDPDRIISDFRAVLADSVFAPEAYADYEVFLRKLVRPGDPPDIDTLRQYPAIARMLLPRAAFDSNGGTVTTALAHVTRDGYTIEAIRDRLDDLPGATLTGIAVIGHDIRRIVLRDLIRLLPIAAICVAAFLIVLFRRASHAVLAAFPAVFGVLCLLAVMWLTDTRLNLVNLVALPLIIGIGVDDGVFLVSAMRRRVHEHGVSDLNASLVATTHAITVTSITTALAFSTLMITSVPAIRTLGLTLAVGITACWVGSVFGVLPCVSRSTPELQTSARRQS